MIRTGIHKLVRRTVNPVVRVHRCPLYTSLIAASPKEQSSLKPFSEMPGLKGMPVFGNIPKMMRELEEGNAADDNWLHKLQSKLGPIYRLRMFGNQWIVVTSSPEAIEMVCRSEGKYPSRVLFEKHMEWIYTKKLKLPASMGVSCKETWKHLRSAGSQQMVPRRVGNFVEPLSVIAEELFAHLENIKDESGNVQDIRPELSKWSFQGISYFVYGEHINMFSGLDPIQKEFVTAGLGFLHNIPKISLALPLYRIYPTKVYREFKRAIERLNKAGKQILRRRYEQIKDDISSGRVDETRAVGLLDQWLIEGKYTEEEALSQSYDMLAGGIDATAQTASFLLYEIAKQPELQERLVQEISSVVGDKEHPSWEDLQKMTLVRNCVKETMRVYTPGDYLSRVLDQSAELMGYLVPAGTMVMVGMHSVSRDVNLFEDPEEFKPDRWSKDVSEKMHPFSFLPFGFGPRACYGRRLAELELYVLMTKVLCGYHLTTNVQHMKVTKILALQPAIPIHIKFDQRV